jgi:Flp pilus assembly protein TadB
MKKLEERVLIYSALVCLCSLSSLILGLTAAGWTFIMMATVIELLFLLADPRRRARSLGQFQNRI